MAPRFLRASTPRSSWQLALVSLWSLGVSSRLSASTSVLSHERMRTTAPGYVRALGNGKPCLGYRHSNAQLQHASPSRRLVLALRAFSYPWQSPDFDTEKTSTMLRSILNWRGTQNLGLIHEPTLGTTLAIINTFEARFRNNCFGIILSCSMSDVVRVG